MTIFFPNFKSARGANWKKYGNSDKNYQSSSTSSQNSANFDHFLASLASKHDSICQKSYPCSKFYFWESPQRVLYKSNENCPGYSTFPHIRANFDQYWANLASNYEQSLLNPNRVLAVALESLRSKFERSRSKQPKVVHRFLSGSSVLQKRRNVETVNIRTHFREAAEVRYKNTLAFQIMYLRVDQDVFL